MKYQFIILIFIGLLFSACSPKRSTIAANVVPTLQLYEKEVVVKPFEFQKIPIPEPSVLISLEKYPCFGKCPVYKIEFFENRVVRYSGKQYMDLIGNYTTTISQTALGDLLNYSMNIDYSELSVIYPISGKIILDVPLTVTYVQYGGDINKIENHHNAPIDLVKFEEHIELLIDNLNWENMNL